MNTLPTILTFLLVALVGYGGYVALSPLLNTEENKSMINELSNVIYAGIEYRRTNRNVTPFVAGTMTVLTTNGYLDSELYSNGTGESVINTDIEIDIQAPGTDSTVTYDSGDSESCNYMRQQAIASKLPHLSSTAADHTCTTSDLEVTLEN